MLTAIIIVLLILALIGGAAFSKLIWILAFLLAVWLIVNLASASRAP